MRILLAAGFSAFVALPCGAQQIIGNSPGSTVATLARAGFPSTLTTNPGSGTLANSPQGIVISAPNHGSDAMYSVCKSAPAAPYSAIIHFTLGTLVVDPASGAQATSNDSGGGFAWRLSSDGKFITEYLLYYPTAGTIQPTMFSIDFSAAYSADGSEGAAVYSGAAQAPPTGWQKLVDNGTQIQVFFSYDGQTWISLFNPIAYASTYFGAAPDQVCLFASGHGSATSLTVDYYKETSP